MASTSIEWTDKTWNPTTGCTKISAGCKHCYALEITKGRGQDPATSVRYAASPSPAGTVEARFTMFMTVFLLRRSSRTISRYDRPSARSRRTRAV